VAAGARAGEEMGAHLCGSRHSDDEAAQRQRPGHCEHIQPGEDRPLGQAPKLRQNAPSAGSPKPASYTKVNVKAHVETAEKTGALNLAGAGLKKLPDKVLQLSNLRTLNLANNQFAALPAEVSQALFVRAETHRCTAPCEAITPPTPSIRAVYP
jgi:hypothetical protein